jgi:hypothetical protein
MQRMLTTCFAHKNNSSFLLYGLDGRRFVLTFIIVMNNTDTLTTLRNTLALRKKKKALALRLALAKAEAMEATYGSALARPFWQAVGEAEKAVELNKAPAV